MDQLDEEYLDRYNQVLLIGDTVKNEAQYQGNRISPLFEITALYKIQGQQVAQIRAAGHEPQIIKTTNLVWVNTPKP